MPGRERGADILIDDHRSRHARPAAPRAGRHGADRSTDRGTRRETERDAGGADPSGEAGIGQLGAGPADDRRRRRSDGLALPAGEGRAARRAARNGQPNAAASDQWADRTGLTGGFRRRDGREPGSPAGQRAEPAVRSRYDGRRYGPDHGSGSQSGGHRISGADAGGYPIRDPGAGDRATGSHRVDTADRSTTRTGGSTRSRSVPMESGPGPGDSSRYPAAVDRTGGYRSESSESTGGRHPGEATGGWYSADRLGARRSRPVDELGSSSATIAPNSDGRHSTAQRSVGRNDEGVSPVERTVRHTVVRRPERLGQPPESMRDGGPDAGIDGSSTAARLDPAFGPDPRRIDSATSALRSPSAATPRYGVAEYRADDRDDSTAVYRWDRGAVDPRSGDGTTVHNRGRGATERSSAQHHPDDDGTAVYRLPDQSGVDRLELDRRSPVRGTDRDSGHSDRRRSDLGGTAAGRPYSWPDTVRPVEIPRQRVTDGVRSPQLVQPDAVPVDLATVLRRPPAPIRDAVLSTVDLVKVYGQGPRPVLALDQVTMDVERRRFTAIMGASGSGKSTLLHCLAGLDSPTRGKVLLGATELSAVGERKLTKLRRDRIGFVFQAYDLLPQLTARQNIVLPVEVAGGKLDGKWLDTVVEALELGDLLRHLPAQLSGGEQQRVAVARAVLTRPDVVLADEPTGALDAGTAREMIGFLRASVDHLGQTVVMVTHDPLAAQHTDRALILHEGRLAGEVSSPSAHGVLDALAALAEFPPEPARDPERHREPARSRWSLRGRRASRR